MLENLNSLELPIFPDTQNPLSIKLSMFEGPLDLLLHLIRKKQVAIYEIRLSELTSAYLSYLDWMQSINLDVAGEFLEIAATLIWIKSNDLLPKPHADENLNEENPEETLKRRLMEYQRYKEAGFKLGSRDLLGRDVFIHPQEDPDESHSPLVTADPIFEDVSVFQLMEAFRRLTERRPRIITEHRVHAEDYRIEDLIEDLIQRFLTSPQQTFSSFFEPDAPRSLWTVTFMAMLEMVKSKLIGFNQTELFGEILCYLHPDFSQNLERWRFPMKEIPSQNSTEMV